MTPTPPQNPSATSREGFRLTATSIPSTSVQIGATTRRLNQLGAIMAARDEGPKHQMAYSARPFVLCGIPVRRPSKSTLEYSRQNGHFRLRVIGHPDYGLPFGQDRLLLIWIASLATWQKSRVIRFKSAAAILETFGLPKDGRYYKRLMAGFERIFYATFFFCSDQHVGERAVVERHSFRFVRDAHLWYSENRDDSHDDPSENVVVLSEEFWNEIHDHPIPVDLAVVRALADSPGNLDLYIWLTWRCWTAKATAHIPLFGTEGLVQQLGVSRSLRDRDFRRQVKGWLLIIHRLWPECPAKLGDTGVVLVIDPWKRPGGFHNPAVNLGSFARDSVRAPEAVHT
jgi:hypothetical protein